MQNQKFFVLLSFKNLAKLQKKSMQYNYFLIIAKSVFCLFCAVCVDIVCVRAANPAMTIVIDPGHGGTSLGATGKHTREKDIVLDVALKIGKLINKQLPDVRVIYTRKTDTLITLEDRGIIANEANADLFLSIHANGNPDHAPYGTETYVMGLDKYDKNMDVARNENAAIAYEENYEKRYEGYDPDSPESFIIFSFMQNTYLDQSIALATFLESGFTTLGRHSRGIKQGPFLVLWKATMPRVLIEIGFITNPEEEEYISSEKGQNELANAIFESVQEYKKRVEGKKLAPKTLNNTRNNNDSQHPAPSQSPSTTTPVSVPKSTTKEKDKNLILPQKVTDNKTTYHVQIFSIAAPLEKNAREFKGLKNIGCYQSRNNYRYYVGKESSVKDIMHLLQEVRKKFPDAFVVKLQNNQPYKN